MIRTTMSALLLALAPVAGHAQVVLEVGFTERQPTDSLLIQNAGNCDNLFVTEIRIDLATAQGQVFFDTAPGEPGYPDEEGNFFEVFEGRGFVRSITPPQDGGAILELTLDDFGSGSSIHIGADIDAAVPEAPGRLNDLTVRDLEGMTVSAMMMNPAGDRQAEVGVMTEEGVATIVWNEACVGSNVEDAVPDDDDE